MKSILSCLLLPILAGLWLGGAGSCAGADRPLSAGEARFFETRIRPLLAERCFSCHGPDKQRSDLRLDSAEAVRRGGSSGQPVLVPGQPEKSLLIRAVRHLDGVAKMPPKEKLKDQQIADLSRWIKMGAPYPGKTSARLMQSKHWAFHPVADPPVPAVKDVGWSSTPLDRFILARLEAIGLKPAPLADRRTLIRRVTFDLTGLPPAPEEVEAFCADTQPDAWERMVDRLLASPAHGERWGRHWLDVARYADSNGLDENVAHGNAYLYRDHVVAAFNRDQPYDDFLREQIAGDLLASSDETIRRQRLIATGFLSLGPKVLAEPDERKMELDIVDEQIDTVGRAFLGLTLGCARCHDHKFDPISTEDYHALAGIFLSTRTMENFRKVARWHENILATPDEIRRKRDHDARVALHQEAIREAASGQRITCSRLRVIKVKRLREELEALQQSAPVLASAMGVSEGPRITDAPLLRRGNHLNPGKRVSRRFPVALAGAQQPPLPSHQSGRLELACWIASKDNPLTARVLVNRVWRWHFGRGLVASVDNFGLLGDRPSHPELLDWLATRFVESGWSLKSLHRLIVLSSTYRMSSYSDARTTNLDPDNRLHARAAVRRLEAEAIRDNLLAVSGALDRKMGGSLLHVGNRQYLFDHTSRDLTVYDSPRRALYLPVIRNNLYDMFQLFDATDATVSNGDRASTTVATQSLFLMNSDLVRQSAARLAARLLARRNLDDAGRARLLYLTAYGRSATAIETDRACAAVTRFEKALIARAAEDGDHRLEAWTWLCHAVLAANEFIHVQ
jgi:cytochrome c553